MAEKKTVEKNKLPKKAKVVIIEEAREKVAHILESHRPLPLRENIDRELEFIYQRAPGNLGA